MLILENKLVSNLYIVTQKFSNTFFKKKLSFVNNTHIYVLTILKLNEINK